jgi:hypothetical protein
MQRRRHDPRLSKKEKKMPSIKKKRQLNDRLVFRTGAIEGRCQ